MPFTSPKNICNCLSLIDPDVSIATQTSTAGSGCSPGNIASTDHPLREGLINE